MTDLPATRRGGRFPYCRYAHRSSSNEMDGARAWLDRRGYLRCTAQRDQLRADLQVVSTVSRPDAPESTHASFVIENGRPGPQLA